MQIEEQQYGAVTVLKPHGPIAAGDATEFFDRTLHVSAKALGRIVIDAADVPFVDSDGLEKLVDLSEELSSSGQTLKLCGVNETLREVFDLTEVTGQFEHFEDVQMAVRSFL